MLPVGYNKYFFVLCAVTMLLLSLMVVGLRLDVSVFGGEVFEVTPVSSLVVKPIVVTVLDSAFAEL